MGAVAASLTWNVSTCQLSVSWPSYHHQLPILPCCTEVFHCSTQSCLSLYPKYSRQSCVHFFDNLDFPHVFTVVQGSDDATAHSRVSLTGTHIKQPTGSPCPGRSDGPAFPATHLSSANQLWTTQQISSRNPTVCDKNESQNTSNLETYHHRQLHCRLVHWSYC